MATWLETVSSLLLLIFISIELSNANFRVSSIGVPKGSFNSSKYFKKTLELSTSPTNMPLWFTSKFDYVDH